MILRTSLPSDSLLLLFAQPPRIVSFSLLDRSTALLVSDCGYSPYGIALDAEHGLVFWTNMGEDRFQNDGFIERVDLDGSNRTEVVHRGNTFTPTQIIVDAQLGHLYWSDCEGMRIMRARLDGTELTILVQIGESDEDRADEQRHCVGVAVDRENRHIYWTQKNRSDSGGGRIFRASLELSAGVTANNRSDLEAILANLPEPIHLQWDERNGFLYWTDRARVPSGNTLNRAKYTGGRLVEPEIFLSGLGEGIGLALDVRNGRAFVSDLSGFVRVISLDRPGESEVILSGHGPVTGIAYVPCSTASTIQPAHSP